MQAAQAYSTAAPTAAPPPIDTAVADRLLRETRQPSSTPGFLQLTDAEFVTIYQERERLLTAGNSFFTEEAVSERFLDRADHLEDRLRRAECRSNVAGVVKLLIYEASRKEGDREGDDFLLRQVICWLGKVH